MDPSPEPKATPPVPPAYAPPGPVPSDWRRIVKPEGGPPPVPSSIVRVLLRTRAWAILGGLGLLILGALFMFRAKTEWSQITNLEKFAPELLSSRELLLHRASSLVTFALAAACILSAPRLFRYARYVSQLHLSARMTELENALRHQRTVWQMLGAAGALWLLFFAINLLFTLKGVAEARAWREEAGGQSEE